MHNHCTRRDRLTWTQPLVDVLAAPHRCRTDDRGLVVHLADHAPGNACTCKLPAHPSSCRRRPFLLCFGSHVGFWRQARGVCCCCGRPPGSHNLSSVCDPPAGQAEVRSHVQGRSSLVFPSRSGARWSEQLVPGAVSAQAAWCCSCVHVLASTRCP